MSQPRHVSECLIEWLETYDEQQDQTRTRLAEVAEARHHQEEAQ